MKNSDSSLEVSKVTIIMPCFNSESTISDSIESVINQTFKNWKLLIIDDNSTYNTFEIIKSYELKENRIRILKSPIHEQKGPYFPRNLGLNYVKTKFVCFLDSDDKWEKEKLKMQISFMLEKDISMSCTFYKKICNRGRFKLLVKPPKVITYQKLITKNVIPLLTVMIDLEKISRKTSLKFPAIHHEDYALWIYLFKNKIISKCYTVSQDLATYRVRNNSVTSNKLKSVLWTYGCYRLNNFNKLDSIFLSLRCLLKNIIILLKNFFIKIIQSRVFK